MEIIKLSKARDAFFLIGQKMIPNFPLPKEIFQAFNVDIPDNVIDSQGFLAYAIHQRMQDKAYVLLVYDELERIIRR